MQLELLTWEQFQHWGPNHDSPTLTITNNT